MWCMHTLCSGVAILFDRFVVLHTVSVLLLSAVSKAAVSVALALAVLRSNEAVVHSSCRCSTTVHQQ